MNRYRQSKDQPRRESGSRAQYKVICSANAGFTIIEAVMVISIASLIFALVFLVIPQLQRAQRDNTRIQEVSRLQTAIAEWRADNRNRYPDHNNGAEMAELIDVYLGGNFADPIGGDFTFTDNADNSSYRGMGTSEVPSAQVGYRRGLVCQANGENWTATGGTGRDYAITYRLENGPDSGGNGVGYRRCVDSR